MPSRPPAVLATLGSPYPVGYTSGNARGGRRVNKRHGILPLLGVAHRAVRGLDFG